MKALIIGATGATGKDLVSLLLEDDIISEVHSFVRKASSSTHPKLKFHVVDFEQPDTWAELLHGDIAFSCLGTTLAQAGSKEAQWRVDYDYQKGAKKTAFLPSCWCLLREQMLNQVCFTTK